MTRIKILEREDLNDEQAAVYDESLAMGGPVGGPYYAYIRIPELMRRAQALRACLHDGPLSGRERQIVHLVVARHWNAKYPWFAQARNALAVGVEQEIIDAININEAPTLSDPRGVAEAEIEADLARLKARVGGER